MHPINPTESFTDRALFYKYRPKYPKDIIGLLTRDCNLTDRSVIADIGTGTGFLAELFLDHGNAVFGIEPNESMRSIAQINLAKYPKFRCIAANAEATDLNDHSIDFIVVGQALHWFDREKACREFSRIIKRDGWLMLIWNLPYNDPPELYQNYIHLLLEFGRQKNDIFSFDQLLDYQAFVINQKLSSFFEKDEIKIKTFIHDQILTRQDFEGLIQSYSFMPAKGENNYSAMMKEIKRIFIDYQVNDHIVLKHLTLACYGHPTENHHAT